MITRRELQKKAEEEKWLKHLLETLKIEGKIIPNFEEKKIDFEIKTHSKSIGIELTRIFANNKAKLLKIENIHSKITEHLIRIINVRKEIPYVEVKLNFLPNKCFPKKFDVHKGATDIYQKIKCNLDKRIEKENLKVNYLKLDYMETETYCNLADIKITWGKYLDENLVSFSYWNVLPKEYVEILQTAIEKKNKKIRQYKETCKCSDFWLLIYAEGKSGASLFLPSDETFSKTYVSEFDKIFFITRLSRKVFTLKLKRRHNLS